MRKNNAIALVSRITEKAHRHIVKELAVRGIAGIVPSHGGILGNLFTGEKITMKELAGKIHRTKPTMTLLIDKLVELGYVAKEKNMEDGRSTYIKITDKGMALEPIFHEVSASVNAVFYKGLSDEEAEFMEAILAKVKRNFDT